MGESTHESAKRQKVSAAQITNAVCEDCGCKWTATLTEVPVTIFIKDLDDYYKKISSNLLEAVEPPMVLCVFRPSDREVWDTEVTLSCVAPRQDSPYHWRINHKHQGPGTTSGCQIIPWRDKILESKNKDSSTEPVLVTVKQEIKEELEEENLEVMDFDPLAEENEIKPDVNPITTVSSESESSNSCHEIFPSTSKQNPQLKRASEDPDDPAPIHRHDIQRKFFSTNLRPILPLTSYADKVVSKNTTPVIPAKRFVSLSKLDLKNLSDLRHEKSTKTATRYGTKVFRDWLEARGQSPEFEGLEKEELSSFLQQFYGEVRKQDGSRYSKQSMISIRAAINRQLHSDDWERRFDIINDNEFRKANHVMEGIFKELSAKGLATTKSHCPLEPGDFKKLIETGTLGLDNPISLQNLVWLNICLYFGKIGIEGWRGMKKDTFIEGTDDQGNRYFCFKEFQKETKYSRMYEQVGVELCPVKALELYISSLSPKINDLWQKPNQLYYKITNVWYNSQALGINTLSKMMKCMSQMAGLAVQHTNHCVRATSLTIMAEAGIQGRDIVKITGHRDVKSIKRYIDRAPSSTNRLHSDVLVSAVLRGTEPIQEAHISDVVSSDQF